MAWSRLDLGVGLVATAGLDKLWEEVADLVQVVEVEPQTLWDRRPGGGWELQEPGFAWLSGLPVPRIAHGVGFPVGGTTAPDPAGVGLAATSAVRLSACHWSEHLSFNTVSQAGWTLHAGFLLPPCQTWAGVEAAAAHVGEYRRRLDIPFLVETGVNYLRPAPGELSDGAFVAHVVERADCGILLDLHNAWVNQRNGRQTVAGLVDELPLERVLEVHLAGGFQLGDHYLDAHSGPVADELLELAAGVLPRLANLRAVVFETLPEDLVAMGSAGLARVLEALHRLVSCGSRRRRRPSGPFRPPGRSRRRPVPAPSRVDRRDAAAWERQLLAYTTRASSSRPADDPGLCRARPWVNSCAAGSSGGAVQLDPGPPALAQGPASPIRSWPLPTPATGPPPDDPSGTGTGPARSARSRPRTAVTAWTLSPVRPGTVWR